VPNTLQYPLERQRDLQRRWSRLLQRTVAPTNPPPADFKYSRPTLVQTWSVAEIPEPVSRIATVNDPLANHSVHRG
jgi:hypothetical protein